MINRDEDFTVLDGFRDTRIIKVVTGIRRCGKSTLLEMYRQRLVQEGVPESCTISLNFEDLGFSHLNTFQKVYDYIVERLVPDSMNYIFLDEVQLLPQFQRMVDSLFIKANCDIYLTGSNAYLLSGELATLLSGRYVEIHLLPLSFAQYCSAFPGENNYPRLYRNYLEFSSFPYTLELKNQYKLVQEYLGGIYNTVILKDIVARKGIADVFRLESVIRFLADNVGNLVSIKKIADTMTSDGRKISSHTVESYLESLCSTYIFYKASRFDIKGKQYLKSGEKYYLCDLGLRFYLLGNKFIDRGFLLENIVYLELIRRGYKVFVGKVGDKEIDFVAHRQSGTEYFQVCETMRGQETRERELASLQAVSDHNPKYILCMDDEPVIDYDGIKQIYAIDWLLGKC